MNISERLNRQSDEDIIILGELLEQMLNSQFGSLLKLMVENLKSMEINNSRNGIGNADRVLGRLEGYENIFNDIEGFINRKRELQSPVQHAPEETEQATEQVTALRGGEI